ncbi:hypothetical protein HA42_19870 [Pantoea deleyi]|nr:hypothetical protein HA42_19870 [Pantoea deleyi]
MLRVTGKLRDRQVVQRDAQQMTAAVVKLLQVATIGQRQGSTVTQRVIRPRQFALLAPLSVRQRPMLQPFTQALSPSSV